MNFPVSLVTGLLAGLLVTRPGLAQTPAPAPGTTPFSLPFKGDIKIPLGPAPTPAAQPSPAVAGADSKRVSPSAETTGVRQTVDSLSTADVHQALENIRSNYIEATTLTEDALNRATLQGLLERLGGGASVRQPLATPAQPSPFRSEAIDGRIGYVRIGAIDKENLAQFDTALADFVTKGVSALIVDLRATVAGGSLEQAAEFIKRLTPKGKVLFTLHRSGAAQDRLFTSNQDPSFHGVTVTLVNRDTAGAAEVVAAALRILDNALAVGQTTAGQAAEFSEQPLSGGRTLRVAVAEVRLPEKLVIFPEGLRPDLPVRISPGAEADVLRAELDNGVGSFTLEPEPVHLNEAALVAGVNPEIDEAEAAQKPGVKKNKTTLSDPALERAVDLIATVQIFGAKAK